MDCREQHRGSVRGAARGIWGEEAATLLSLSSALDSLYFLGYPPAGCLHAHLNVRREDNGAHRLEQAQAAQNTDDGAELA